MMGARGPPGPPGPPVSSHTPLQIWTINLPHNAACCSSVVYVKTNGCVILSFNRALRDTPDTLVSLESLDRLYDHPPEYSHKCSSDCHVIIKLLLFWDHFLVRLTHVMWCNHLKSISALKCSASPSQGPRRCPWPPWTPWQIWRGRMYTFMFFQTPFKSYDYYDFIFLSGCRVSCS